MRLHPSETIDHLTPEDALQYLRDGNARFLSNLRLNRNLLQQVNETREGQWPFAAILSCIDSRTSAELIFDQGLGDMFVVRTAGHVLDSAVLGSIEYAVTILNVPLIVVLGHDSCGAVRAALDVVDGGEIPPGYIRDVVERVTSSVLLGRRDGLKTVDEFEARHVLETGTQLLARSAAIKEGVENGSLAVVGVTYHLADGRASLRGHIGDIGEV